VSGASTLALLRSPTTTPGRGPPQRQPNDGFASPADLQLRGPGDLFGTAQPASLASASPAFSTPRPSAARKEAMMLEEDPELASLSISCAGDLTRGRGCCETH
jgi:RecG-like helicase